MKRGILAKRTGCNIETIRYYEQAGILPDPPRLKNGYRVYDESHEHRLRFIMRSRELGFSVEEVRELLDLVNSGRNTCGEVHDKTQLHLEVIRKRIADLQKLAEILSTTVEKCQGGTAPTCPVVDALMNGT